MIAAPERRAWTELATGVRAIKIPEDHHECRRALAALPTVILVDALTVGLRTAQRNPRWLLELVAIEIRGRRQRGEHFTLTAEAAQWIRPRNV